MFTELSFCTIGRFGKSLISNLKGPIDCVSLENHPCQAMPTLLSINSTEALFFHLLLMLINVAEVVEILTIHVL